MKGMQAIRAGLAAILLGLFCTPVVAGEAMQRLHDFTENLHSFSAGFVQTRYDEDQKPIRHSKGLAWLQRPGLFRWEYREPYQQTIVADGKRIWIYDADLQQVTVKKTQRALGTAPIMLLSKSRDLSSQFEVKDLGQRQKLYWVRLKPKEKDGDFKSVYLGFDAHSLKVMELHDQFGQSTQIRFNHVRRNPDIAAAKFHFTPPPDADVIGPAAPDNGGAGDSG